MKIMVNGIELGYVVETDEGTGKRYAVITGTARKARGDLAIPAELDGHPVTSIGERAFFCCSDLTSVTIPNSVTSIGEGAFYECTNLTSVTIPDSVTSIGDSAFCKCSSLTSVSIGNGVTSIGEQAFYGCTCLTSVTIPNSVTSIGEGAFYECTCLTSVTIPNGATSIGASVFSGCSGLTSVTIPNSVTCIREYAFFRCSGLAAITIPNSVTSIRDLAFSDCSGLTSVTIPNSVTSIWDSAFSGCSGLASVSLPGHLKGKLPVDVFAKCSKDLKVTYRDVAATKAAPKAKKTTAKKAPAKKPAAKTVKKPGGDVHGKVQLWKDGPYWATTNIGAENPEDFGYYFWWGDTVGYKREKDKWVAAEGSSSDFWFEVLSTVVPHGDESPECVLMDRGWITDECILKPEHDAAHVHWGGGWRMPTHDELDDLVDNCDWAWTKVNDVDGYVVRGRGDYASASIFLPAAGQGYGAELGGVGTYGGCWASDPGYESWDDSWDLSFWASRPRTGTGVWRYIGLSVRPVQGFTK